MKKLLFLSALIGTLLCFSVSANTSISEGNNESYGYQSLLLGAESNHYAPEDESTATQLIAEAVRLHGIYNGTGIEKSYNKDEYLEYALDNGIIYDRLFDDYESGATRAEAIFVLSNAVPASLYSQELNNIVLIPDCEPSAGYYEPLMAFYKAGIVTGYDKYGAFRPGASITNKDLSDLLSKLVNPEKREIAEYEEYASDETFYLIDDFIMTETVRDIPNIGSGWRYDYTGSLLEGVAGQYKNVLRDISSTDNITISRQIFPQHDGVLTLEVLMTPSINSNGITVSFDDADDVKVFTLGTANNTVYSCAAEESDKKSYSGELSSLLDSSVMRVRLVVDLDNSTAASYVGGVLIGTHRLASGYSPISKISISTGVSEATNLEVKNVHLYKNYKVNDVFRMEKIGNAPLGYTTSGDIKVQLLSGSNHSSTGDVNSVIINAKSNTNANAHKDFDEVGGLVKLEAYMLLPTEDDGAYFTASYKGYPVFKIETKDGKFFYGDTELYDYRANIWQNIHVEADTNTQTFLLRINGKLIDEALPFTNNVPGFDSLDIGITPENDCTMWFDDVEVHEMFLYEDYCPEPVKLETDYYVSMSVCNLWRNGSHYGWEYIAPHDDLTPYLGYYDEGLPETMDWEIKFLAEHGVSFYNMCWYAPASPQDNPIKKPRMVDAFHDGFMNAKYSDMLDFTIMFENTAFYTEGSYDSFVNNIWPFWVEWYLKDDRYFTIDNKPFLVIYNYENWIQMCYDPDTGDMTEAEIHADAIVRANNLFRMMEQDMKDIGYDGLILTFTNKGNTEKIASECLAISAAGVFPYSWGSTANTLERFRTQVESAYSVANDFGIDLLAVGGIGFNHIGWKLERWDLMSVEEFTDLLLWFRDDFMKRYETKYANDPENLWKSKFIQFATWNEYGEGHYLFPSNVNGFGYLDAIAEVFGAQEHDTSLDVIPTAEQKARVGHLYPGYRNYIRRKYFITPEVEIPDVVSKNYDFTQTNSISTLGLVFGGFSSAPQQVNKKFAGFTSTGIKYDYSGEIKGTSSTDDPMMRWELAEPINAKDCEVIHIRLSCTKAETRGDLFFRVEGMTKEDSLHRFTFDINETGVQDYYIPTKQNSLWDGTITLLRIDPGSLKGNEVRFYSLELMNYSDALKELEIFIDDAKFTPSAYDEIRSFDKYEIYIAPTEEDHFYRQLHIVYDWNVHTKKLRLETPNETVFEFENGSKNVLVNGSSHTLEKTFEVYDGCPVIPLLFILDKSDYDYTYDFTGRKLEIKHLNVGKVYMDLPNGDAENEYDTDSFFNHVGGKNLVSRAVDPANKNNHAWYVTAAEGKSHSYFRTNIKYEAGKTYTVDFDFKLDTLNTGLVVYDDIPVYVNPKYPTAEGDGYDHHVSIGKANYSGGWTHFSYTFTVADDYITTDLQDTPYQDTITIFLSPFKTTTADEYGVNYYVDNFSVRTTVTPFTIYNGDAETDDKTDVWGDKITIETETLDDGTQNRYWSVVSGVTNKEAWSYFNQYTEFIPGMTYYYEVDVKIGQNTQEHDVKSSVYINARYDDALSNSKDHHKKLADCITGEGWVTCQGSFTISYGYKGPESGYKPSIAFFANPAAAFDGSSTDRRPVKFMIDNFKVYSLKPEHFE